MSISTTTYRWNDPSPIATMEVVRDVDGKRVIHLIAREGQEAGSLTRVPVELHRFGVGGAYADAPDGRTMLVIPNVRATDAQKVIDFLQSRHLTAGEPTVSEVAGKSEETLVQYLGRNSLKLSGKAGLVGQIAFGAAGAIAGDKARVKAAGIGSTMEVMNSVFGNGRDNLDTDGLVHQMAQYFKSQGIPIPDLVDDQVKDSLATAAKRFVGSNSFLITNGMGAYGCYQTVLSGLHDKNSGRIAVGSINGIGKAIALGVPEKNAEEKRLEREERVRQGKDDTPRSPIGEFAHGLGTSITTLVTNPTRFPASIGNLARNNPLAIDGALRVADNGFVFVDAYEQMGQIKGWKDPSAQVEPLKRRAAAFRDPEAHAGAVVEELEKELQSLRETQRGPLRSLKWSEHLPWKYFNPSIDTAHGVQVKIGKLTKQIGMFETLHRLEPSQRLGMATKVEKQIELLAKKRNTAIEWPALQKAAYVLPWIQATAWLVSSSLAMISTKNSTTRPEDDPTFAKLYATTAKLINQLPTEERQSALQHMSDYFTTCPQLRELGVTTALFESLVKKRLSPLEANPWTTKIVHSAVNSNRPSADEAASKWTAKAAESAAQSHRASSSHGVA